MFDYVDRYLLYICISTYSTKSTPCLDWIRPKHCTSLNRLWQARMVATFFKLSLLNNWTCCIFINFWTEYAQIVNLKSRG